MSNAVLIMGESGTGKSTSIRTLPPEETYIINVINKPLPFKGANKKYFTTTHEKQGNLFVTDNHQKIMAAIDHISEKMPHIKYLVIDDMGYTISNSFMRKASLKGYDKFTDLAVEAWEVFEKANSVRTDLTCFIMMHSDVDAAGRSKPKTIGKMLDEKVCIEGLFTIVLHSLIMDGQYYFLTNFDGQHMAKSPLDMLPPTVPNDLKLVADAVHAYYNEEDVAL